MNRRAILISSIVTTLIYTIVFVIEIADYEAWRMVEMDKNPYKTPHPFVGTFHGGLMTVILVTMWCTVGVAYLQNIGART